MTERPQRSRSYLSAVLLLLFAANLLNYLDRQVVSSLESELRPAFSMTKAEFGYLWSSFTLGYMVFAPIIGFLSDRRRRPRIFAACVLVWSLATMGSGLVSTKLGLYGMRFLIGVGEAGCLVVGPTLLSDWFPVHVRGRALSLFYLAMPIGGTAGYLVGGLMSQYGGGFRNAFLAAGAPGLALAVVLWKLADPPRGGGPGAHRAAAGVKPYWALLRNRVLLFVIFAQAAATIVLAPVLHFAVRFFEQTHGMTKVEATFTLGGIALAAGVLGSGSSGVIGDRLARRRRGAYALLAGIGYAIAFPGILLGFTAGSPWVFVPALILGAGSLFLCMPAVNTEIANAVPATQRAMAYALAVFVLHLLGDMSAPPVFGAVADEIGAQSAFFAFSFALVVASGCALIAARAATLRPPDGVQDARK